MSASDLLTVYGGRPLTGDVEVPGDKSISHRALVLGAIADGDSVVRGLSGGEDVRCTESAVASLGAVVRDDDGEPRGSRDHVTVITGCPGLHAAEGPIDCGNSGTGMRLLAGLVAGYGFATVLAGDTSLSSRPMDRIADPLTKMGAFVEGRGERCLPPLSVRGGNLRSIDYAPPVPSAQVKSCVLVAALHAEGETLVTERVPTRRHTEELLEICGAHIEETFGPAGHEVRLRPSSLGAFDLDVPGDPSQAAFWVVAGCVVPGSQVVLPGIYAAHERRGFIDVLRRMGADIEEVPTSAKASASLGAASDLVVRHSSLTATDVDASEITGLDEVPVLAVAAAMADGTTTFSDVGELKVKESDRLTGIVAMLDAFGASAETRGDDLVVHGAGRLRPGRVDSLGDHRIAMSAAVAGSAASGRGATEIDGWSCVATSYPGFAGELAALAGGS